MYTEACETETLQWRQFHVDMPSVPTGDTYHDIYNQILDGNFINKTVRTQCKVMRLNLQSVGSRGQFTTSSDLT